MESQRFCQDCIQKHDCQRIYEQLGDSPGESVKKAFELVENALSRNDELDLAHSLLGILYMMTKDFEKGLITVVRNDTGKEIKSREMDEDEKQMGLLADKE